MTFLSRVVGLTKPARRGRKPRKPIPRNSKPIKRKVAVRKRSDRRARVEKADRLIERRAAIERRSRPRKHRKTTLAALKRKLWKLFAKYVKDRDGNTCKSCGRGGLEGSGWHAGHLFPAGMHNVIRFEPKNVHSQCFHCNVNLGGNGAAYATWFLDTYGVDEFQRLSRRARDLKQWKAHEVQDLIAALEKGGADYETLYAERYGL